MSVLRFRNSETGEWQEIVTIQGAPGADGYTPVKGVDYFTEEDIAAIVDAVTAQIASLEDGDEVSY